MGDLEVGEIAGEAPKPSIEILKEAEASENMTVLMPETEDEKDKVTPLKNRSDIFSLNENNNLPSTIFSVGGAPSKTISKPNDTVSSQSSTARNPVTGIGVSSNDEFKNKPAKRRDGNPLLGVGYKDDDVVGAASTQRIPPGGHSKGLW